MVFPLSLIRKFGDSAQDDVTIASIRVFPLFLTHHLSPQRWTTDSSASVMRQLLHQPCVACNLNDTTQALFLRHLRRTGRLKRNRCPFCYSSCCAAERNLFLHTWYTSLINVFVWEPANVMRQRVNGGSSMVTEMSIPVYQNRQCYTPSNGGPPPHMRRICRILSLDLFWSATVFFFFL